MGSEWKEVPFNELGEVNRGRSRHRPRYAEHLYGGSYPFIQTGDIRESNGRIVEHTQTYSEAGLEQSRLWPAGTMCITIAANIAETAILTYPACFPDSVVGFIADENKCDVRFIEYNFRLLKRRLQYEATGSVQDNINLATLSRVSIPLPPLPEQKAIAHILGSLDDKIELNRRMNATLEGLAQALFQSWFVDFNPVLDNALSAGNPIPDELTDRAAVRRQALDNGTANREAAQHFPATFQFTEELGWIPEGWDVMQWGDIAKLEYGKSLKGYRDGDGSVPVYGTNGAIGLTDKVLCENEGIIIGRKGAYRGVHFSPVSFYVIDTAFYLSPQISFSIKWAYYEILGFDINGMDSGSAIPSTSRDDFYRLWSVFPAANIQTEFERIISSLYEKKLLNDSESESLSILRDTLIPQLISGKYKIATK